VKIDDHPAPPPSAPAAASPEPAQASPAPVSAVPALPRPSAATRKTVGPAEPTSVSVKPTREPDANWITQFCPPPADNTPGPGTLLVTGPCGLEHKAAVRCESSRDDFVTAFTQKARNGASLVAYANVEFYHGPGAYDATQIFIAVQNATSIYRWSNDNAHTIVAPDEAYLSIPETKLTAEPMLVDCSHLIGPSTNYEYQCAGRTAVGVVINSAPLTISGTLQCARGK
jgi:hypothetical protein